MVALLPLVLFAGALTHAARIPHDSPDLLPTQQQGETQTTSNGTVTQPLSILLDEPGTADGNHLRETKWACDVRAWVRAPDLRPDFKTQADARLAMNGTDCVDVKSWSVGLRYKERQILRLRAQDAVFPVQPRWNDSFGCSWFDDDILRVQQGYRSDPFSLAMEEYKTAISHPDLWEVHGAEQVVFDVKHELASVSEGEQLPLDAVRSFTVHVPNTNFPPTPEQSGIHRQNGNDEMVAGELIFEYYFDLTLHNGTKLEYPTSYTGFHPSGPVRTKPEGSTKERVQAELMREEGGPYLCRIPECNKNNSAQFRLEVEMPEERAFVQGSTVYLDATLIRTGNGSEVPVNITLSPLSKSVLTWAQQFPQVIKANLTMSEWDGGRGSFWPSSSGGSGRMRKVHSDEELEREAEQERKRYNTISYSYSWRGGRFGGEGSEVVQLDPHVESQQVKIPVKISNHTLSSFHGAFVDFVSSLGIQLDTRFECESEVAGRTGRFEQMDGDESWTRWRIPPPPNVREYPQSQVYGNISINIVAPSTPSSSVPPTHYLSPGALAPVLSGLDETDITFPLVGALRNETMEEFKRTRYYARRWEATLRDGKYEHAATIWQRKEKEEML